MSLNIYIQSLLNHKEPFIVIYKHSLPEQVEWSTVYNVVQFYAKMPYIIIPSPDNQSIIISYIQNPKRVRSYEDIHGLNYII
jgi:hypothetical protein